MRTLVVALSGAVLVLSGTTPASATEVQRIELEDVPSTVQAGTSTSVSSFVPLGARCRLIIKSPTQRWKGPRRKAKASYMQFSWFQQAGQASGQWRARVRCRDKVQGLRWKSRWSRFTVTLTKSGSASTPVIEKPTSMALSTLWQSYGWTPFGTTLVSGADWFGGRGVDVRSNGGNGCASGCSLRSEYGSKYQCVELVNRFVRTQGWVTSNIWGNARDIYRNAPRSAFAKYRPRSGYVPVPGDIIVWRGGSAGYGHVAVVSEVADRAVTFVEQNASRTGTYTLTLKANGRLKGYGSLRHFGFLHAHANGAKS